jgi:phospholipid/cholesterol/gamma-HCH transport system substrate-binding protein
MARNKLGLAVLLTVSAVVLSGCGFSPYKLPLPGGADLGSHPYSVKVQFRDVLDLVPQSAVRVNDLAVGKVTDVKLNGWTATVTIKVNGDTKLPDNAQATIRQTSLLGEKFVSLAPPTSGATGSLSDGDTIPLDRSGRNPEIEEVLGAASLLFNGGGLEKTNTIVRELNDALAGNEPEVKELIASSSAFLTQLDDNKADILTSLEKVNRLAVATNKQKSAITGALDNLPAALRVVNGQRDDLVTLLQSLDRLSDVATGVIRRSKADTVADLKALVPTLRNLAAAGDDLATGTRALLTYPFTDGFVGNTYANASGNCLDPKSEGNPSNEAVKEGACFGDFANLAINVDIDPKQITNLLAGLDLGSLGGLTPPAAGTDDLTTDQLVDLIPGLVTDGLGGLTGDRGTTGSTKPKPTPSATTKSPSGLCTLLKCRTGVPSSSTAELASIILEPVVTR